MPDPNLQIVLLGEDFLMSNNVSIKYDDKSKNIVVHVNDKAIMLLNQTENLKICNSSTFFTKSMVTEKISQTDAVLPEKNSVYYISRDF